MNTMNPDINPVKSFFKSVEKKLLKHSKHLYFKTVISQKSGAKNIIKKYKEASTGKSPIDKTCPSKHSIKGIPFNLGTVEVPKLSFVKKSFSI